MAGPLAGLRIIEIAGIGPGPFCGMMLADHGAEVIRIERPGDGPGFAPGVADDILVRSRRSVMIDLKTPEGIAIIRDLCRTADGLIEGFRPGVMERLGLGPDVLLQDNPRLVYGRMTGWGQEGPYAHTAGHDINYIALSGNLHTYGRAGQKPTPPANAVGDFGGGGMMLAFGMVSAILHARQSGQGQAIDCAMVDGAAVLASMIWSFYGNGHWRDERGANLLDTGAPFYDSYETADGKFIAIGPVEPQFYRELLRLVEATDLPSNHFDARTWPEMGASLDQLFRMRTRQEWCALLEGSDACFAPVLSLSEAPLHPHNQQRGTFLCVDGKIQPAPAPRYTRTVTEKPRMSRAAGEDSAEVLSSVGYDVAHIADLKARGIIGG
ncbi:carnitine dehydratase [Sphingopyxis sp. H038]|uniref:CaiB/BaiF CoA transferase family protein n=1 Tax=unclassified Sphingopyxis TaxID=2614943 RepID=UPI00073099DC|nr:MULTISPECIES: CaiB/BaiF CoA-transferase family protein [unclassified Sphingopyxis]KTE00949.1 carnitine dehydratase [Sphingopyxis sp. H012]KTE05424.1 carnitine dehydratase [Sphingopyxis sp. H093]KTE08740.1 carnitine dehydratase [Sphingopyxis sp. H053]KTE28405.1 carnitine dehydratase [Sphingopyxis sp. H080]KTE32341.1 carnitine dehydratase [Sphingopyxis sp. H038]